jgi:HrpA-like RNA helicase
MSDNKIGILDPDGENINPLNKKPYSDNYKKFSKFWSVLPTYKKADEILKHISEQNILLIQSGTGSGKSVITPKLLLHHFNYDKKIIMILPKQILTKTSASYAADTLDVKLGEEIGYKFRGEKKYNSDTKILYTTDGTLVSMLMKDPELKDYYGVVLDEAHERRTQTDFLLYLLKQVCLVRDDFKLIIMSATIDQNIFADYFFGLKYEHMEISGKPNYPIKQIFLDKPINQTEYLSKGVEIINQILQSSKDGDILFFVPSIQETFGTCKKFAESVSELCIEVFAGMNKEREELAIDKDLYKEKSKASRKIIIATNVAESSMTIDGIKFIIDSGYENFGYFNPEIESKVIEKRMITKAQIKQRMGRTGRTSEGTCYHLYTQKEYDNLDNYPKPAIQTSNIYSECLNLLDLPKVQNLDNLRKILRDFIEPPKENYINYSEKLLLKLGMIENSVAKVDENFEKNSRNFEQDSLYYGNGEISKLGKLMSSLPVEPMQGLAIYYGYKLKCEKEIMMIVSISEVIKNNISDLFQKIPPENQKLFEKFNKAKNKLKQKDSDHYTLLKIMTKYANLKKKSEKELDKWLFEHFLKGDVLHKSYKHYKKMKGMIIETFNKNNIEEFKDYEKYKTKDRVLISLTKGYFLNIVNKSSDNKYKTDKIKNVKISKDSWLFEEEKKRILYTDLLTQTGFGTNTNMQICSYISDKIKNLSSEIK